MGFPQLISCTFESTVFFSIQCDLLTLGVRKTEKRILGAFISFAFYLFFSVGLSLILIYFLFKLRHNSLKSPLLSLFSMQR